MATTKFVIKFCPEYLWIYTFRKRLEYDNWISPISFWGGSLPLVTAWICGCHLLTYWAHRVQQPEVLSTVTINHFRIVAKIMPRLTVWTIIQRTSLMGVHHKSKLAHPRSLGINNLLKLSMWSLEILTFEHLIVDSRSNHMHGSERKTPHENGIDPSINCRSALDDRSKVSITKLWQPIGS